MEKNVLPGNVKMTGDARALSKETNEKIASKMLQIVEGICNAHGVNGSVKYETTCPVTFNSKNQVESATKAAISLLGSENVMEILSLVYFLKIFLLWQVKNLDVLF